MLPPRHDTNFWMLSLDSFGHVFFFVLLQDVGR
jgi:hypothetical protein